MLRRIEDIFCALYSDRGLLAAGAGTPVNATYPPGKAACRRNCDGRGEPPWRRPIAFRASTPRSDFNRRIFYRRLKGPPRPAEGFCTLSESRSVEHFLSAMAACRESRQHREL